MLSTETPPEPPCSCKVLAPKSDERAHPSPERLAVLEADPAAGEAETTHFSIRDYVLSSRSKDFGTNWPFPKQYLQLCLKHGVRNLLPPFEPPDLVRARCSGNFAESQQLVLFTEVDGVPNEVDLSKSKFIDPLDEKSGAVKYDHGAPAHESVLGPSDPARHPLSDDKLIHGDAEPESTVTSHDQTGSIPSPISEAPHSVKGTRSVLEESVEVEATKHPSLSEKVESLREPSEKKCRLIVKFGGNPESNRTADPAPNSCSVLEPMASKVCPVCRTFTSTSNTTLNAHIDQCLSVESSSIGDVTKFSKHKVKPKKRSMVEILATAPRCTLEDLDRRNGTNWALDSTLVAPVNGVSSACESKRSRISPLDNNDSGSEGAVYVDSSGTKLRILSKFNDAIPAAAVHCPKPKKFIKELGEGKSFLFSKRRCFPSGHKTFLKAKVQSKKMSPFKKLKGKIHKELEGNFHMDMSHMEESISKSSSAQEQLNSVKPRTLGQWVCSKRSGLPKYLNGKLKDGRPRSPLTITHHTSVEGDVPVARDSYAVSGRIQKFSTSSDALTSPVKTRSVDMLSNTILASDDQEKHSANFLEKHSVPVASTSSTARGLLLKISRSSRNYVSSARKKRMDLHANVAQNSDKFGKSTTEISEKCNALAQKTKNNSRKSLLLENPMGTDKCTEVVKTRVPKSLRKHRSAEKSGKQAENLTSAVIEEFHGGRDLGPASNNVTSGTIQSNFSVNISWPETRDTFDQVSPSPSNSTDPKQGDDDPHELDRGECITLNQVQHGVECHHIEVAQIDAQDEASANLELVIRSSFESAVGTCDGSEAVTSGGHQVATCDRLDLYPLIYNPKEPSAESEAVTDASVPRLSSDQGIHCGDISQDIHRVGETEAKDDSCSELQNAESRIDAASFQGPCACLTSHRGTVFELLQENSSVVFCKTLNAQNPNMEIDGEPSRSPVSAASSVSDPSVEELKFKDAEPEPSQSPVAIQEKLRSDYSMNLAFLMDERVGGTERTILGKNTQGVTAITHIPEPDKFSDGQLNCCPQREESIPRESQHSRQSVMAGMTLPTKQMASSFSVRPVMSSFGACSNFISEAVAAPVLDSPTDSISAKASSDFHPGFLASNDFGLESPSSSNQTQSTTNPVLRLMGKNLMVMNREEQPVQQNQSDPCSSPDVSHAKHLSLLGLSSAGSLSNQDNNIYHPQQFLEGCMLRRLHPPNTQVLVPPPTGRMSYFVGTPLDSGLTTISDSHAHERRWNEKPNSSIYDLGQVCLPGQRQRSSSAARPPFPESDVIVIDDSPELEVESSGSLPSPASTLSPNLSGSDRRQARPFSCLPSQNPFQLRELGHVLKPGFPVSCPRANTNFNKWGGNSGPLLPSSFVVPSHSASHLTPTVYYSTNFR